MSFLGGKGFEKVRKTIMRAIPGSEIVDAGIKVLQGIGVLGKHSDYNFNPNHPPGQWRGRDAYLKWKKMREDLGYAPLTNEQSLAYKKWQRAHPGASSRAFVGVQPMNGSGKTAGELTKDSSVMPGGSNLELGTEAPYYYPLATGGWGTKTSGTGSKRRAGVRRERKKKRGTGKRKRSSGARKLKFGSPAWRKKYLGHKR